MAEFKVGAADIFIKDKVTGLLIYLGLNDEDGSTSEYGFSTYGVKSAQYGDTPVEMIVTSDSITLKANFLDTSLENIARFFPTATMEKLGETIIAVTFGGKIGQRLSESAVELICHPIAMGMNTTQDIIIYKAANTGKLTLTNNMKKESIISAEFTGMPDFTRPPGDQLFRIGQPRTYETEYLRLVSMPISPSNPTISIGGNVDFTANAIYEDGSTQDITTQCTWISSATNIATIEIVNGKAKATALAVGTTVIRAQFGNVSNSTILTVEA